MKRAAFRSSLETLQIALIATHVLGLAGLGAALWFHSDSFRWFLLGMALAGLANFVISVVKERG